MTRAESISPEIRPTTTTSTSPLTLSRRPAVLVGAAVVVLTVLGAVASAVWPELGPSRHPRPTLHGTPGEAVSIFVTNARSLIAPLLLSAGRWHTGRATRHIGDAIVAAVVIANPVMVGLALGRHPTELLAYLPHLPLEDAALTIAASAWVVRRLPGADRRPTAHVLRYVALTLAVALLAAVVETYAVPHAS
ncbi:MAG TPA: hypothetical protein VGO80_13110 [Solirubrobacteraceae bacterium]|jgi:hypothetical protein|nr:hypothetical protein [Solirubrobacteraceae bacterium]